MATKVTLICPKHGEFEILPQNLLRKDNICGCPKCNIEARGKKLRLTTEEFISKSIIIHGDKYDYSKTEVNGTSNKVIITCPIHGEFEQFPHNHIKGHGCPKCSGKHRYNTSEFIEKASAVHNNLYTYPEDLQYLSTHIPVKILCKKHGEFWQTPANHLRGQGCPKCRVDKVIKAKTKSTEEFIAKAKSIHGNKYDYSKTEYIKASEKVTIICPEHGEFIQQAEAHLQGQGCPKCKLKNQTKLFNKLKLSFPSEELIWEASPDWLEGQRFDIYFPKYNIAVEYDGRQHFISVEKFGGQIGLEQTQERDKLKNKKCRDNNCILFRLKFDYIEDDYVKMVNQINTIICNTIK